jgi:hypothetical protein
VYFAPTGFLETNLGRLPGVLIIGEFRSPSDEYTGESLLHSGEYVWESRLPGAEYTGVDNECEKVLEYKKFEILSRHV